MKNWVLEDIKEYAKQRLLSEYKFCGIAESDDMAMLNSSDGNGNDIKINIKIYPE